MGNPMEKQDYHGIMPVDRDEWYKKIGFSNFANTYHQFRDLSTYCESSNKVLEVGPGQGLTTQFLRWKGYEVTTLDVDETFEPDVVCSVNDLSRFPDGGFDVAIVSHVLEHIPISMLEQSLSELSRVASYSLIYLPVAGNRHFQVRVIPGFRGWNLSFIFDIFNYFKKPTGEEAIFCQGQHYWEIGYRGFRVADTLERFEPFYDVLNHYRNKDWNPSYNFVLKSKHL